MAHMNKISLHEGATNMLSAGPTLTEGGKGEHQLSKRSRRASKATQVANVVKGVQKAGLGISAVRLAPDGTVTVIPGTPEAVPSSEPNPWDGVAL